MSSLSSLLKKYNLQPRKGLGQNFLANPFHLDKIIEAAQLSPDDIVLEIGPGPGMLTERLAQTAGQVVVVELDPNMVALLRQELGHLSNLTIIEADILQIDIEPLIAAAAQRSEIANQESVLSPNQGRKIDYKVVANLPYYITSAALRYMLEAKLQPSRLVLTIQKEVAQRIVAQPGAMSLLAISIQFYGRPHLVHQIPSGAFYPPPKVDSAVIRIDTYDQPPIPVSDIEGFFRVVKAGFSQKRKQLKNTLAAGLRRPAAEVITAMEQIGLDPTRRAQTLSLEEWGRLAEAIEE